MDMLKENYFNFLSIARKMHSNCVKLTPKMCQCRVKCQKYPPINRHMFSQVCHTSKQKHHNLLSYEDKGKFSHQATLGNKYYEEIWQTLKGIS